MSNPDNPASNHRTLDAFAVQSAGLRRLDNGEYASTRYSDSDDFGMLGGYVRVLAAQELYWQNPAIPYVFCNGKSAKQIAKFGPDVPTDAEIYAKEFQRGISRDVRGQIPDNFPAPKIILENTSVNTIASIRELVNMSIENGWKHIGVVSSEYHVPRIKALSHLIIEKLGHEPVEISYVSAEATLKELRPGVYDDEIDRAYQTPTARERIKNEANGLSDIAAGRYHIGEFQLARRQPPAED